jgi:hypothetical protein
MNSPAGPNAFLLALMFHLPAGIALFFAWAMWIGNRRPAIAKWRLTAFYGGLIAASVTTVIFQITSSHMLKTLENAHGIWLTANWAGAVLWLVGLAGGIAGKSWGRGTLIAWTLLMFLGEFGISSAMIP